VDPAATAQKGFGFNYTYKHSTMMQIPREDCKLIEQIGWIQQADIFQNKDILWPLPRLMRGAVQRREITVLEERHVAGVEIEFRN
jgi:hypothetical protein